MAITRTNLHHGRIVEQIRQNLIGLHRDMYRNAQTHKAMANAQSPPVGTLLSYVRDAAANYLVRLRWVSDWRNVPAKESELLLQLTKLGWTGSDIGTPFNELLAAAQTLNTQAAAASTYQHIITACNNLLAVVDSPDSIWQE